MGRFATRRRPVATRAYQAVWNGAVVARSDDIVTVDGHVYFPSHAVNRDHLEESATRTICPWKGRARYFDVVVDGVRKPDGAWHYPRPGPLASKVRNRVAFWRGVHVEPVAEEG